MLETAAALVYDSAVFGPASPVLGHRYRFAVAPAFGSISYTSVTADYRRYVMPVRPFTIAMRVMHQGRYGSGADDPRLLPLAWTLRDVVRGYGDTGGNALGVPYPEREPFRARQRRTAISDPRCLQPRRELQAAAARGAGVHRC